MIGKYVNKGSVVCSDTSGLSLTKLAEFLPESIRSNYMGMHMFNPTYNMTLCEMIPTNYTDKIVFEQVNEYVKKVLRRTSVVAKDLLAFLGNRIGFQFINEALIYAEKYKDNGGIDYIDAILGPFTGRSMAPLVTSDFMGLDVHKAIVDNIQKNTSRYAIGTFETPDVIKELVDRKKLGRKTGEYQVKNVKNAMMLNIGGTAKTNYVYILGQEY